MFHARLMAMVVTSAIALAFASSARAEEAPLLKLEKGEHICIIGNTLADRLQHTGWLETYLYARNPDKELVIRNLGYAADEIDYTRRLRSKSFGTPDEWLSGSAKIPNEQKIGNPKDVDQNRFEQTNTKADVSLEQIEGGAEIDRTRASI